MSKLSESELKARRKRMQQEALKSVAKSEQLNIRMDEDCVIRLYSFAAKAGCPVGTMVREWIVERLKIEESGGQSEPMQLLMEKISMLSAKIEHWDELLNKLKSPPAARRKKVSI
jgi:hypothetical protein